MYTLSIHGRSIGPYEAIRYPDGHTEGDILPLLYDTAILSLTDSRAEYILCYKRSKSLLGAEIRYGDLVNKSTGETFSLQMSTVFFVKIVGGDPKIIGRVGDELRLYEHLGKTTHILEPDGDKPDLVPLGYYDCFIAKDGSQYVPIILNEGDRTSIIARFSDYYGYRSYTDTSGGHFLLLVEDTASTVENPVWYFTDNFHKISDTIHFDDPSEEIDTWGLNGEGNIWMRTTMGHDYTLTSNGRIQPMIGSPSERVFTFTRAIEDTDSDVIIAQNDRGYFIIRRDQHTIDDQEKSKIRYYSSCLYVMRDPKNPLFLMVDLADTVVVVNRTGDALLTTDLAPTDPIIDMKIEENAIIGIRITGETSPRRYAIS